VRRKIGDCLIKAGLISHDDLQRALAEHRRTGERIGAVLVRHELVSEPEVARMLAQQLGLAYINLTSNPPDAAVLGLIPRELASKRLSVAARFEDDVLVVATADPLHFAMAREVEAMVGSPVKPAVATRSDILRAIQTGYAAVPHAQPAGGDAVHTCRRCAGALEPGWRFCPFCASSTALRPGWRVSRPGARHLKPAAGEFR
jgi:hypothetical protein